MARPAQLVFAAIFTLGALGALACQGDHPAAARTTGGADPDDDENSGSGGVVPPAPNFDPNLFDSGPPPSPNEGTTCEGVPIGTGTIDQENLVQSGAVFLTPSTGKPYQTFTVETSGYLAGIELAVQRADVGSGETIGRMRVELRTFPGHELLANSELPLMNFPLAAPPQQDRRITLASGPPGKGYFPFGESCTRLTAGSQYYFQAMLADVPVGVCGEGETDGGPGICTVGRIGDECTISTQHCDPKIWLSSTAQGNPYPGGGWNNGDRGDIVFRTYMQP